ncbi:MAG TPA: TRAP transporter small permease [Bacillota bacterium]|nr:TRAP transporter small permease [Bacillota bacterium]
MLNKFDDIISKILEVIMTVCLSLTVVITFVQVVFRYVLKISLPWSQELLMVFFVYSIFFGAAVLVHKKDHLVVDLFDNLPDIINKLLMTLESFIAIVVLLVFIYYGMGLVNQNLASGQTMGLLPFKRAYLYLVVPVTSVFMIYFYIRRLYKTWVG